MPAIPVAGALQFQLMWQQFRSRGVWNPGNYSRQLKSTALTMERLRHLPKVTQARPFFPDVTFAHLATRSPLHIDKPVLGLV
jgi:hypothetical protein